MRKTVQIEKKIFLEYPSLNLGLEQLEQIALFLDSLAEWNKKFNLTAIKGYDDLITKHLLDSLAIYKLLPQAEFETLMNKKIIDFGSGAGLTGIILCLLNPKMRLTSIDKTKKKIDFQKQIKAKLNLTNFNPLHQNLKQLVQDRSQKENYNFILARAFDQIKGILELSQELLTPKGYLVLWKGQRWQEEFDKVPLGLKNNYQVIKKHPYQFGEGKYGGTILLIQKNS